MALQSKNFLDFVTFARASAASYFNAAGILTQAANNVPRMDYEPVTKSWRGFLIEEARTNLLLRAAELDDATWTKTRATVTANAVTAPDNTLSADKIVEDTATGQHLVSQPSGAITAGTTITASVFVRAGERTSGWLQVSNGAFTTGFRTAFDLSAVTASTVAFGTGTAVDAKITDIGNGWYRVTVTGTLDPATTTAPFVSIFLNSGASYAGDGLSGFYVWGAQLEAGAFPTSYIPTVGAAVTRAADSAIIDGSRFAPMFNQSAGTLYAKGRPLAPTSHTTAQALIGVDDGTNNNRLSIRRLNATGIPGIVMVRGGVVDFNTTFAGVSAWATGASLAVALSATPGNQKGVAGGVLDTNTYAVAGLPTVTRMTIGANAAGDLIWNGWIEAVRYYPKALSNAELQAMTA